MTRLATLAALASVVLMVPACGRDAGTGNTAAASRDDGDRVGDDTSRRGRRGGGGWRRADADGDGVVTRAEVTAESDARFARLDANGDGRLEGDERNDRMRRADAGEEGPVTKASLRTRALARFDRFDADKDGRLAGDELGRGSRRNRDRGGDGGGEG